MGGKALWWWTLDMLVERGDSTQWGRDMGNGYYGGIPVNFLKAMKTEPYKLCKTKVSLDLPIY